MQSCETSCTVHTGGRLFLQEIAQRVNAPLTLAPALNQFTLPPQGFHQLGLAGVHQRINASLAVQLTAQWEQAAGHSCGSAGAAGAADRAGQVAAFQLPAPYVDGLRDCVWPGRAQVQHCDLYSFRMLQDRCLSLLICAVTRLLT